MPPSSAPNGPLPPAEPVDTSVVLPPARSYTSNVLSVSPPTSGAARVEEDVRAIRGGGREEGVVGAVGAGAGPGRDERGRPAVAHVDVERRSPCRRRPASRRSGRTRACPPGARAPKLAGNAPLPPVVPVDSSVVAPPVLRVEVERGVRVRRVSGSVVVMKTRLSASCDADDVGGRGAVAAGRPDRLERELRMLCVGSRGHGDERRQDGYREPSSCWRSELHKTSSSEAPLLLSTAPVPPTGSSLVREGPRDTLRTDLFSARRRRARAIRPVVASLRR